MFFSFMGRCSIQKLKDIQTVLAEIRGWPSVQEPTPATFYVKRKPFLHFHEKDERRWADIKSDGEFVPQELPFEPSTKQIATFLKIAKKKYKAMIE